jgi:hypothetical protein
VVAVCQRINLPCASSLDQDHAAAWVVVRRLYPAGHLGTYLVAQIQWRLTTGAHLLTALKAILAINNSLISLEFATGYVTDTWDDRMHILITITSCGTLVGQALSKTAFAVTLLKLTKNWAHRGYTWVLWFCIVSMNLYMLVKVITQWGKICNKKSYDVWYRLDICLDAKFRDDFKEGGNSETSS